MKKFVSVLLAIVTMAFAAIAAAGVVVDEQQTVDELNGARITRARTVMIEGDRQKSIIDNGARTIITDLDKGTMTILDGRRKTYVQIPFPPKTTGMTIPGGLSPSVTFKKTGGHDSVIGYSCDEYSGAGTVTGNSVTMSGCFSGSVPGAADYSNFQRVMADKVKGTTMANMGDIPPGVPLRLKITTTIGNPPLQMPPAQARSLREMLDHRQFVTDTTVSKISMKSLTADSFQVPADYRKQAVPPFFGRMGGVPSPAATPHKAPK
ncbi:MAG: DUF4412 domain-containing protein [Deltaproteobacteria bacterium]|nr:DUF4412 domain-containing protein [Deltaproteobacteria bacterium]